MILEGSRYAQVGKALAAIALIGGFIYSCVVVKKKWWKRKRK